jgi:ATP-dependent helicase HepA
VVVEFPDAATTLTLATGSDALVSLQIPVGRRARLLSSSETVIVESFPEPGRVRLTDGRVVPESDLWPIDVSESLTERLAHGDIDRLEDFALRLDALHLAAVREADGLGSFLGGRIRLFPHQLYVAERATRSDPVRWLLADEVGLGKTVESCLILNRLLRTGRASRTLVAAPGTLTVQWLGELWRKFHQVFVLLDAERLSDVEREYGAAFNPFDAYERTVVGLEFLRDHPKLTDHALAAGIDLLIVDEAHHLRRPPGHPGNAEYRAIQPMAAAARHVLLLTATPLEDDAHGFFRLLQLLRPDELPEGQQFEERLRRREPLPACTSSTRRDDIGGLPPRVPGPVEIDDEPGWRLIDELVAAMRALPAPNAVARREKARKIRRALASGAALEPLLDRGDQAIRHLARGAAENDPRTEWLARSARRWRDAGEKTLVFAAQRETLEAVKAAMSRRVQLRVGLFHEEMSSGQRDIEVAQFRLPSGPSMLVSTECGGEGRNFEFCTRLVLFDLPWNPMLVEQRIGRLDRIGRRIPVEIVYFKPPSGLGAVVAGLFESIGLFEKPLGGLERELAQVEAAIEELALSDQQVLDGSEFASIVTESRQAWDRVQQAAYHELYRAPYDASMAEGILGRVPSGLDELTEEVVLAACESLDLHVEPHEGSRYSIELGRNARVEGLPGVTDASSFLGTFDREEAVQDESIDYFASGHPLVEGILAHLEDSPTGRVALLHASIDDQEGFGLLAIYKAGPCFDAVAFDASGDERPDWARWFTERPLRTRRVRPESWTERPEWPQLIRTLASRLPDDRRPLAVAAVRIEPRS